METVKRSETSKDFLSSFSGIVLDTDGTKSWYMNGNLHREDGPAVEWGDGDKWWYIDGLYRGNNKCIFTFYQPSDYLGKDKTNVIDVYVNFLRKKIDKDFDPKLIHTQVGMGYIMKEK